MTTNAKAYHICEAFKQRDSFPETLVEECPYSQLSHSRWVKRQLYLYLNLVRMGWAVLGFCDAVDDPGSGRFRYTSIMDDDYEEPGGLGEDVRSISPDILNS